MLSVGRLRIGFLLFASVLLGANIPQAQAEPDAKLEADLIYTVTNAPAIEVPAAVQELARLQSIRGLRAIIARRNFLLIDLYRENYPANKDEILHPGIQDIIIEHFGNPAVRSKLVMFVDAQPYDQQSLFEVMLTRISDESPLEGRTYWYKLITNTALTTIEDGLLENIEQLGAKARPHILAFLARRGNAKVLPFLDAYTRNLTDIDACREFHGHIASLQSAAAAQLLTDLLDHYGRETPTEFHIMATASLLRSLEDLPDNINLDFSAIVGTLPYKQVTRVALAYISLAKFRHATAAVPDLLPYLHNTGTYGAAYEALISMNDEQVWRQTRTELDKAMAAGVVPQIFHKATTALLDERIKNSGKYLAAHQDSERLRMIRETISQLEEKYSLHSDPFADLHNYFWNYLHFLQELESVAAKAGIAQNQEIVQKALTDGYRKMGNYNRFMRRDPEQAVKYYDLAASTASNTDRFKPYIDYMLAAETYLFDLDKKQLAGHYYRAALDNLESILDKGNPSPSEVWMQKWLSVELNYLSTGATFSGALTGEQITGISFFAFLGSRYLDLESMGIVIDRHNALMHLQQLPKTHMLFFDYIKALREEDQNTFRNKLRHIDPSGYWLTSYFGMIEYQTRLASTKNMSTAMYATLEENAGIQQAFEAFKKSKKVTFNFNSEQKPRRVASATDFKNPTVTFDIMKKALEQGDMQTFLNCFSSDSRGRSLHMIKGMSRSKMAELSRSLVLGEAISEFDNYLEFMVFSENGIPASSVIFVLDQGEWKISDL